MKRGHVLALVAAVILGGVSLSQAADTTEPPPLGLRSTWPVEAQGLLTTTSPTGAIRLQPDFLPGLRLQAEEINVEVERERGYDVQGESSLAQVVTESDRETIRIQEAEVRFEQFEQKQALFLAYAERESAVLFMGSDLLTYTAGENLPVVQVGTPSDSVEAGEPDKLRFTYTMEGNTVQASGPANGQVTGDFAVFLHDVQIQAHGRNQDWSGWTGYQEEQRSSPITEYEFRLTSIQVTNGTFRMPTQQWVDLFAPTMEIQIEGDLSTPKASGSLLDGAHLLIFEEDAARIEGSGTVNVSSDRTTDGESLELVLQPSGNFVIEGASRIQTTAPRHTDTAEPLPLWPLGGASAAAIVLVGLTRAGWIPIPTEASRSRRHERWMARGREAQSIENLDLAARCFGRAVRIKWDEPLAWYKWATIQLELDDPHAAEIIAKRAEEVPGVDRLDLLNLRSIAAWRRDDPALLTELLTALATEAPLMARRLVTELSIERAGLGHQTLAALDQDHPEGPLDGYA